MCNRDENALYELLGKLKEAIVQIQEEIDYGRSWETVAEMCDYALSQFED